MHAGRRWVGPDGAPYGWKGHFQHGAAARDRVVYRLSSEHDDTEMTPK